MRVAHPGNDFRSFRSGRPIGKKESHSVRVLELLASESDWPDSESKKESTPRGRLPRIASVSVTSALVPRSSIDKVSGSSGLPGIHIPACAIIAMYYIAR